MCQAGVYRECVLYQDQDQAFEFPSLLIFIYP